MLRLAPAPLPAGARSPGAVFPAEGAAEGSGGADDRLRHAGDRALDQRGRHPRAHPPRHRGGAAGGAGLLRRPRPPHGPRARGARGGAPQHRRLDAGDRRGGPRRHPDHRLGLRHDGQGLRLHAAHRPGLCGQGRARLGARHGHLRIYRPHRLCRARCRRAAWSSPIIRPARCSTDRKSRASRKNCFPRSASWSKMYRKDICAAVRPGPTTFCSRTSRRGCVRAKSGISRSLRPT